MTITCVIIGQSNSISKDGYAAFLENTPGIKVARKAVLGASPSVMAPMLVRDKFFDGASYCIIDFAVVDAAAAGKMSYTYFDMQYWTSWACHMARKNGCEP